MNYITIYIIIIASLFSQAEYVEIDASSYNDWVYFSFLTQSEVVISDPESSIGWDIAFMRNHIKTNSGTSGIGAGGVFMDSENIWTNELFDSLTEVPLYAKFEVDTMMNTFYDIITHTMSWGSTSSQLETWGWFDFDNNYTFNLTNHQFIIRSANGNGFIKLWPFNYYSESGSSGHISFLYDMNIDCNHGMDQFGYCGGNPSLDIKENNLPKEYAISSTYPNPFNPVLNFDYIVKEKSKVVFKVFDLSGKFIDEIFDQYQNSGKYKFHWDAKNYPSGHYFLQMFIDGKIVDNKKVIYLK